MNIAKKTSLKQRLRDAFKTTKRVLSWGEKVFGWKQPKIFLSGTEVDLVDQIWSPLLEGKDPQEVRKILSQWKAIRTYLMKLLGSSPEERKRLQSSPPKGMRKWMKSLAERWLEPMRPEIRRAWTTAMFSTRAVTLPEDPNYETITQDSIIETPSYASYVGEFWRALRISPYASLPKGLKWSQWHLTSKQGPNGLALHTLMRDYVSLPECLRQDLSTLGGSEWNVAMQSIETVLDPIKGSKIPTEPGIIRKISSFGDIEGKTRVIAVLDYFSQSCLKPFHSWLFRVLKRIPQDYTFNQGGFLEQSRKWDNLYSCDLTAATDRFPISVIVEVLLGVFPSVWVKAWRNVMVGYPFWVQRVGKDMSYSRGNPMGAYSSWSSFTLTHHFIMFVACKRSSQKWGTAKYAILGDDVLIGDTQLYREYRQLLVELDVPVSEAKTHESKDLCEFAKRWIYQGHEITPFPIPAMMEATNQAFLAALLVQESERGYGVDVPSSVRSWFETVINDRRKSGLKPPRRGFFTDLEAKALIAESLILVFRGKISWEECFIRIHYMSTGFGPYPYMDSKWIRSFWAYYLRTLWLRSSDTHVIGQIKYHEFKNRDVFDPHVIWLEIMMEYFEEIYEWTLDEVLVVRLIPWVSLAEQMTNTCDDVNNIVQSLLKQELSNSEGWEAVRRLALPDLGLNFRERKYNVTRVLAGKMSSDLLIHLRGKGHFVFLTDYHTGQILGGAGTTGLIGTRPALGGRAITPSLSPLLSIDNWEGQH